ncbi:MAG: hypothetical protein KC466_17985, partial [Myxococcales bacterium]|nr:hypothetical protein [Myxococcales bacterium]
RVGDTFRWKSENVSTTEVEQVLNAFEQIKESTVYGVEVEGQPGRAGMAAIVAEGDPSKVDLKALTTYLREQVPAYAVPVFIRFVDSLEVTGTFKHRKVELRKEGYDPAAMKSAPYVLFHGATQYEPITPEMYHDIRAGQHRL